MEVLKDYPQEFAEMFRPSFSFLFKTNLKFWFQDESWLRKYWRFLYIVPVLLIFIVLMTIDICNLLKDGDIVDIVKQLPTFLIALQAILKLLLLFPNSAQITHIIKELGALWRSTGLSDKQLKDKHSILKRVSFCNTGIYWISLCETVQFILSPLFETLFNKLILQKDSEFRFPIVNKSYPFNPTRNWIVYLATYAFQTYSSFLCLFAYVGTELILTTLCALLAMEFTMLGDDMLLARPVFNKTHHAEDGITQTYNIKNFVKKHQKLISLTKEMDKVFNVILFVDLLLVGGTTCLIRYSAQFSRGPFNMVNQYMEVVTSLLYILLPCYYGDLLTRASLRIGDVAYENSMWYIGNKDYRMIIFMIIKRSQNACCLTSLKYIPITLNMFAKVISTTWTYISFMNSLLGDTQ